MDTNTNTPNTQIPNSNSTAGLLKLHCLLADSYIPVSNCKIVIMKSDSNFNNLTKVLSDFSDSTGILDNVKLSTPSIIFSYHPNSLPYGIYNIGISKPGYNNLVIRGVQVFPNVKSIQNCRMTKAVGMPKTNIITISAHKMVTNSGSKVQGGIKPTDKYYCDQKTITDLINASKTNHNMRVLNQVVVPSAIIVHAGSPYDDSAPNYTVPFVDYIRNVASSEIYSTWNSSAIRANVYCIVSFALNRIYTEWYPSHGNNFDITNDTALVL